MQTIEKASAPGPEQEKFKTLLLKAMDDPEFREKLRDVINDLFKRRKLLHR